VTWCLSYHILVLHSFGAAFVGSEGNFIVRTFIPKLLLRLLWFFRRTAALFRQIRTFPQLFRFGSDLGNSGIRQIVRNTMLTGR